LTEAGYHLGTLAIMGVAKPTHKCRRYPDGKIQEIKFPEKTATLKDLAKMAPRPRKSTLQPLLIPVASN
jgi:hypothetical protein